jgi:hypothetical protein
MAKLSRRRSLSCRRRSSSRPAATGWAKVEVSVWTSSTFRKSTSGYRAGSNSRANVVFPAPLAPAITIASGIAASTHCQSSLRLPNVLPFSGERRTVAASVARPRAGSGAARAVAASAPFERAAQAFGRSNGLLGSAHNLGSFQPLVPRAASTARSPSSIVTASESVTSGSLRDRRSRRAPRNSCQLSDKGETMGHARRRIESAALDARTIHRPIRRAPQTARSSMTCLSAQRYGVQMR